MTLTIRYIHYVQFLNNVNEIYYKKHLIGKNKIKKCLINL